MNITCTVDVLKSGIEPTYKILRSDAPISPDLNIPQYTINPVRSTDIGSYKCVFSANGVDKESENAVVVFGM